MNTYTHILIERPDEKSKTRLRLFRGDDVRVDFDFRTLQAALEKADFYTDCWPDLQVTVNLSRHNKGE